MKLRLLSITLSLAAVLGSGYAAEDAKANAEVMRQNVGVGLGTLIWSNVGTGLLPQICAATTNGTFGNQTFAVTTGTSGAKKTEGFVANPAVRDYVAGNLDSLARDMAAGQGETLATVAELAGIPESERAAFYAAAQTRFATVFGSADVTADQVVAGLEALRA